MDRRPGRDDRRALRTACPAEYRHDLHDRRHADDNPAGSILMGLNNGWAHRLMAEVGATVRQIAAAAVKAFEHAARNPLAQFQRRVTIDEVLASPQVAGVLTRLMCSSFTDGAAAVVLGGPSVPAPASAPRIIGSVARSGNGLLDYHDRLTQAAEAAWEAFGFGPGDADLVELHDATAAEELYALESLGFFGPGEAGPATEAGATGIDSARPRRELRAAASSAAGHPLGATGLAQVVELATQFRGRAGARQVDGARTGVAVNTGGIIYGDAGFVGIHAVRCRIRRVTGIKITGWGIAVPDKVVTNDDMAVNLDTSDAWIVERTGIRERHIGGTTSGLAIEAAVAALARAGRTAEEIDNLVLATTTPDGIVPGTAPSVQHGIGMQGGAFDLNAACSGFVYGLVTAAGLIAIGSGPILLIGSETLSRITDMDDRKIAIIVGDGAGAVVVEPVDGPGNLISWNLNSDGSLRHLLKCEHGGHAVHGRQGGLPPGRPGGRRVGRAGHGRRRPGARRHLADGAPPGQPAHHPGRLPTPRHPRGAHRRRHRPLRQHLVGLHPAGPATTPSRRAASTTATTSS